MASNAFEDRGGCSDACQLTRSDPTVRPNVSSAPGARLRWIIKPFKNAYKHASRRENISAEISGTGTIGPHYQPNASREFYVLAYSGGRLVGGVDMYVEGFDVAAVAKRLQAEYSIEEGLPFPIRLMLAHLIRAESERTQNLSLS